MLFSYFETTLHVPKTTISFIFSSFIIKVKKHRSTFIIFIININELIGKLIIIKFSNKLKIIINNTDEIFLMQLRRKFNIIKSIIIYNLFFTRRRSSMVMIVDGVVELIVLYIVLSDLLIIKFSLYFTNSFVQFFSLVDSFDATLMSSAKKDFFLLASKFT